MRWLPGTLTTTWMSGTRPLSLPLLIVTTASENQPDLPLRGEGLLSGPKHLDDALTRFLGEVRVDEAVEGRRRRRSLGDQAAHEATLAGVLVELGEAGTEVNISAAGDAVVGTVTGVGRDFVALHADQGTSTLVRTSAIIAVRIGAGTPVVRGDRSTSIDTEVDHLLGPLATERPSVLITTTMGERIGGQLMVAGVDVVRLRTEGTGSATWLATAAIAILRLV
jgi:hypothetical protein